MTETRPFDPAAYLKTPADIAEYLIAAFESDDSAVMADALGVVARAHGMSELARETGLSRQSLYRALSKDGSPELATIVRVIHALGLRLDVRPAA